MASPKRIVLNDDGWIMSQIMTPVTAAVIKERIVDTYVDSGLDTLSWCIGDTGRQRYETVDILAQPNHLPQGRENDLGAQNLRRLIDSNGGPVTIFTKLCHEMGLKFLPSVRMNSHYDRSVTDDNIGTIRRDHPEYLIGRPGEDFVPNTTEWGIRTGLDYARLRSGHTSPPWSSICLSASTRTGWSSTSCAIRRSSASRRLTGAAI